MRNFIFDTIVSEWTGKPLEAQVRVDGVYKKQQEELYDALQLLEKTQMDKTAFEGMKVARIEYDRRYAEEAYRLGIMDDIEIGRKKNIDGK